MESTILLRGGHWACYILSADTAMCIRLVVSLALAASLAPAENWTGFRGPSRQGISPEKGLPVRWSATENVAWKTAMPGAGWSSPIVWQNRVFLTTATEEGVSARILALDRYSGRIL